MFMIAPPRTFKSGCNRPVSCTSARTFTSIISNSRERFGSGNAPNVPKPRMLMSRTRPVGTVCSRKPCTSPAARSTSLACARSHGKWFNFSSILSELNFAGGRRERLQKRKCGPSFWPSSMNDFPIPEDPPVRMTEEKGWSASLDEGTTGEKESTDFCKTGLRPGFVVQTEPIRRNMNSQNNHELIVSGIHLELTPSLKTFVREKAERLFRHEERIVRIRVELACDRNPAVGVQFKAKGHIQIQGPDMNASVQADECHKAVSMLIDKLDRMLQRRHQLHRVKRNHPRPVELNAEIPKALV